MYKKAIIFFLTFFSCYSNVFAQDDNWHFNIEGQGIITSSKRAPFWMTANQYGSIPLSGVSASFIGRVNRDYDTTRNHTFDWGLSFEGRSNLGEKAQLALIEGFAKARAGIFELKAGRSKETMGLVDPELSSGSFTISGNALGIPNINLSIPEYYTLPFFSRLFAFKANFANGWVGKTNIQYGNQINQATTYFHQASLYGRFGKPEWKLKLYGGINHEVLWGNEKSIFPPGQFQLSKWKSYEYVVLGKAYQNSKVGNHIGSLDVGLDYSFDDLLLFAYRQSFYDKGAIAHLTNIADGLNGISLTNQKNTTSKFRWHKVLLEVLYTANQAGSAGTSYTQSGAEDYYNSYIYAEGWSYNGVGLGTPFISTKTATRNGLASSDVNYFINNRLLAFHTGIISAYMNWLYTLKISYSRNYGTYSTSGSGYRGPGGIIYHSTNVFKHVNQLSTYFEGKRQLKNGINIGYVAAFDLGDLYYNSFGGLVKVSKSF